MADVAPARAAHRRRARRSAPGRRRATRLGRARVKRAVLDALDAVRVRASSARRRSPTTPCAALPGARHQPAAGASTRPASCCTPTSAAPRCPPPRSTALATAAGYVDVEFDLGDRAARAPRRAATLAALRAPCPTPRTCSSSTTARPRCCSPCTALAAGREIVVSRGELVEIGDGFRLPDLIESTGARLREVGTTNRVTPADYAAAIGPDTGCRPQGAPEQLPHRGLHRGRSTVARARRRSARRSSPTSAAGCSHPTRCCRDEPDVASALRAGAAVVTCSGDKLLGGPQAGLVARATRTSCSALRRHPLARALRVDKLTLAALEATLDGPPTPTALALRADPRGSCAHRCDALAGAAAGRARSSPSRRRGRRRRRARA